MLLADLGADIVRVDRPEQAGGARTDADSHLVLDRGRRSIAVDLKHPHGPPSSFSASPTGPTS